MGSKRAGGEAPEQDGTSTRGLTAAERDVATLAAAGLSNAAIALRRGTAIRTVANQMASILRKLRIGSRHELSAHVALVPHQEDSDP
jgi:DNA-binding CsgD family transcriptional regulator